MLISIAVAVSLHIWLEVKSMNSILLVNLSLYILPTISKNSINRKQYKYYLSRLTIIVFILTKFLAFKISPVKFMNVFTYLIPPGMPIYCRLKIQSKPKYVLTSLISTRFQNNDDDLCQERESGPWL